MSGVRLINGDSFERVLSEPAESVDSTVFSPPYWDKKGYNCTGDLYGNEKCFDEYRENTRRICRGLYRTLKSTGSMLVNVGFKRDGRLIDLPSKWAEDAETEGFTLQQKIVWFKNGHATLNAFPFRERDAYEIVLHLTKEPNGYYYHPGRAPYKTGQASAESQHLKVHRWVARKLMTYEESLKAHAEIDRRTNAGENNRIYGPTTKSRRDGGSRARAIERRGFAFDNWHGLGGIGTNVWAIGRGSVTGLNHPCPYPVKLAEECIRRGCPPDGTVFDPFMGVGSTAIAALKLNRGFVGIEIMREHWETAKNRVKKWQEE